MYADVPSDSRLIRTIKEFRATGPRELTPDMLRSIHDADKPVPRGKKADKGKQATKAPKGPSPKKRKQTKATQSPQPKRRKTQPKRKLVIPSSSSNSEYEHSGSDWLSRRRNPSKRQHSTSLTYP
ncbi:unnamed protein product [Lactuca saligna]|uniref:Uncharacterized protein n=1 Tax=Lactuca saligna TaxID=75948 RepID=A0AA35US17_LACSI|nr:unnamed protein product [Lactuca saligna]